MRGWQPTAPGTMLHGALAQLPTGCQEDARAGAGAPGRDHRAHRRVLQIAGKSGLRTRFHGDYHLGQVLVARNDFVIIDFEGEPARTSKSAGPRARRCATWPACCARSTMRAGRALRREAQNAEELQQLDAAARDWEQETRNAFLDGYAAAAPRRGARPTRACWSCSSSRRPATNFATNSATGSTGWPCLCKASWRCSNRAATH